jgi:hypothetical protein
MKGDYAVHIFSGYTSFPVDVDFIFMLNNFNTTSLSWLVSVAAFVNVRIHQTLNRHFVAKPNLLLEVRNIVQE